jgi:hypothetical protein
MSGSLDPIGIVETTIEDIVDTVEEIFPAKPGGMVTRHRDERARREAAEHEAENIAERIEEASYKAVKVAQIKPNITVTNSFIIPAGGNAQILPLSKYRFYATVVVVTAASSVLLSESPTKATGGIGFPLATAVPQPINSRAQLYAFNPGGTAVTVAVLVEVYEPEK